MAIIIIECCLRSIKVKSFFGKKFIKLILTSGLILVFILGIICSIVNKYTIRNIKVENNSVIYNKSDNVRSGEKTKWNSIEIPKRERTLLDDITIYHEGKKIKTSVYEKNLSYYIDFYDYVKKIGGSIKREDNKEIVLYNNKSTEFDKYKRIYVIDKNAISFRGEIININERIYFSINDIENMLGLRSAWNIENKNIYMFNDKKINKKLPVGNDGKGAFLRIEDVSSGGTLKTNEAKEKLKIVADNLYQKGMKFHVAWIPRYVDPSKKIDNDLLRNNSIENVQFINMLDHLIQKGGVIGLHGYTHQSGNQATGKGFELNKDLNSSEGETRKVIENGIKTAKTLNIPIGFYESPHYGATRKQQKIIEEYFTILYEPYLNVNPMYSFLDKNRLYVPTPYNYVKDKDGKDMVEKIMNSKDIMLVSFFIHPLREINNIRFKDNKKGYVDYEYSDNSPINNIADALYKKGYKTIHVTDLR